MAEFDLMGLEEAIFEPIERNIADDNAKYPHIDFSEGKQHFKCNVLASYYKDLYLMIDYQRTETQLPPNSNVTNPR